MDKILPYLVDIIANKYISKNPKENGNEENC